MKTSSGTITRLQYIFIVYTGNDNTFTMSTELSHNSLDRASIMYTLSKLTPLVW